MHGQGGLLDVKAYKNTVFLSFSTTTKRNKYTTAIAKATLENNQLTQAKVIFHASHASSSKYHFGGRMVIDSLHKHLYLTIGDRGDRDSAQQLDKHAGSIVRLSFEGKAVSSNPFTAKENQLPEIFSYGHRNPQGIDFYTNPTTKLKELWSIEFGPRGGDEINFIEPGVNYGWPVITYGREYWGPSIGEFKKEGMAQPIHYYTPSISPSGMMIYSATAFKNWQGDMFLACLGERHLRRVRIHHKQVIEEEMLLKEKSWRIRHVMQGPQGHLYISTDSEGIFRLSP